jgi:hypothetical protein
VDTVERGTSYSPAVMRAPHSHHFSLSDSDPFKPQNAIPEEGSRHWQGAQKGRAKHVNLTDIRYS